MSIEPRVLVELKEKLLQEKNRVEEELSRIAKPIKNTSDYNTTLNDFGDDEDENASEVEEYTDNIALEATLQKQLTELDGALDKMTRGVYGLCENCKSNIPIDRLMAYPAAKICLNC